MKKVIAALSSLLLVFVFIACSDDESSSGSNNNTVTGDAPAGEVFISEYFEGPGYAKYIEIYNNSEYNIDLTRYTVRKYHFTGDEPGLLDAALYTKPGIHSGTVHDTALGSGTDGITFALYKEMKKIWPNVLPSKTAIVFFNVKLTNVNPIELSHGLYMTRIPSLRNTLAFEVWDDTTWNYNGDDGLALLKDGVVVDVFGPEDPSTKVPGGGSLYPDTGVYYSIYGNKPEYRVKYAMDHRYIRKPGMRGSTVWSKADWDIINLTVGIETNGTPSVTTNMAWNPAVTNGTSPDANAGIHTP